VVAVKDGARLVARDRHGHTLGDPGVDHVPDCGAAAVMAEHPRDARVLAGRRPRAAEVTDLLPDVPARQMREEKRDDVAETALVGPHPSPMARTIVNASTNSTADARNVAVARPDVAVLMCIPVSST